MVPNKKTDKHLDKIHCKMITKLNYELSRKVSSDFFGLWSIFFKCSLTICPLHYLQTNNKFFWNSIWKKPDKNFHEFEQDTILQILLQVNNIVTFFVGIESTNPWELEDFLVIISTSIFLDKIYSHVLLNILMLLTFSTRSTASCYLNKSSEKSCSS